MRRGRTVRDLMSARLVIAEPEMTLPDAANLMRSRFVGSSLIMDAGRVVGIVTAADVLHELGRGSSRPAVQGQTEVDAAGAIKRARGHANERQKGQGPVDQGTEKKSAIFARRVRRGP